MNELAVAEFHEYVTARQAVLYRSAVLLTGNHQDAEDLLQTALARLAGRWHWIQRTGSPDAYVRKAMYHQRISWWRLHRNRQEYAFAEVPEVPGDGDLAADTALRLALASVLRQLTPKQRAVVILRYYDDLPEGEVAAILGCSVGTVRSQTHRTLVRLRELCAELASTKELI